MDSGKRDNDGKGKGAFSYLAAYAATATASLLTMWASVRRYAYLKLRDRNAFDYIDHRYTHEQRLLAERNMTEQFVKEGAKEAPLNPGKYLEAIGEITGEWREKTVSETFKRLGFRTIGHKMGLLSKDERMKVGMLGMTAAVVMMGAILKMSQDKKIAVQLQKLNHHDREAGQRG